MVPPARLASTGALFGTDWLFDTQAQCMAATGDFDGALAVAEMIWSQTSFICHWYGSSERGTFLVRLATARDRPDLAHEVTDSLHEGARRSPAASARRRCSAEESWKTIQT